MIINASGMRKGLTLLVLLAISATTARADVMHLDTPCNFRITGEITEADLTAFTSTSCGPSDMVVVLLANSPGGNAQTAMAIGRWLRERNANVFVPLNTYCYSSCALVYISGIWRMNVGEIGLHRPYLGGAPRPATEVRTAVETMLAQTRAYVAEMGITPDFTNIILNTPPADMRIFPGDTIKALVPEHDLLYDELSTARQAKTFGLSTQEYRRRDAEADEQCIAQYLTIRENLEKYSECRKSTLWGLSMSVYKQRQAITDERCEHLLDKVTHEDWSAWEAAGNHWTDHPAAIEHARCVIPAMRGN